VEAKTLCGQTALLAAVTLHKYGYLTRVVHYEAVDKATGKPVGGHVQAQAKVDGEWRWLQVMVWPPVRVGVQEFEGEIDWTMSPHEYLQRLLGFQATKEEMDEFLSKP
jgi:hypothetical protein